MAYYCGPGTTIQYSTAGTTVSLTTLAQVISISGPGSAGDDIETTVLSDTTYKTFKRGNVDGGTVTIGLAYDPDDTTHSAVEQMHASGSTILFQIQLNGATATEHFTGYVQALGREIERDALVTRDVTVKVSGDPWQ